MENPSAQVVSHSFNVKPHSEVIHTFDFRRLFSNWVAKTIYQVCRRLTETLQITMITCFFCERYIMQVGKFHLRNLFSKVMQQVSSFFISEISWFHFRVSIPYIQTTPAF